MCLPCVATMDLVVLCEDVLWGKRIDQNNNEIMLYKSR